MGVLLELLSDIEHRQWSSWAYEYIWALESERDYMLKVAKMDYSELSVTQKSKYLPWGSSVYFALMATNAKMSKSAEEIVELASKLDHEQRRCWLLYQSENMTFENVSRWERQINTKYEDLSENEKDSDREWAKKLLDALGC